MKQRPDTFFSTSSLSGCLLYGNNTSIEDYIVLELLPLRTDAKVSEIKTFTESELLGISKEKLYLETSLFEAPKLYVVRDVTDKFLPLLQSYQAFIPLVMVGKNLKSSSKIVTHMVNHPKYAAVGIYGDDLAFLKAFVHYQLRDYKLGAEVLGAILSQVVEFSSARQQINILRQLYSAEAILTVNDVENVLITPQEAGVFKVAETIVSKNPMVMIEVFQNSAHIFQKEMIPLLRIIAKQFWDLVGLRRQIDQGQLAQSVVNQAMPMIPFNRRPQMTHNLSKWTISGLLNAIVLLDEMEMLVKQSKRFSTDLMERHFLQMTKL